MSPFCGCAAVRLVRSWRQAGDAGLVSRQRGGPSHNRLAEGQRERIGTLLRESHADFGPTLAAAAYLQEFIDAWNRKFAVEARDAASAHRPWTGMPADLDAVLARREERVLSKALTFRSGGSLYSVRTSGPGTALRGARVVLHLHMDGSMRVHYKNRVLARTAFKALPMPAAAADAAEALAARLRAARRVRSLPGSCAR